MSEVVEILSEADKLSIESECKKYPQEHRASALMSGLRIVQISNRGFLTNNLIAAVARYIGVPVIQALEVATFYNMFYKEDQGRCRLCVCTNVPCMLMGANETVRALLKELNVSPGEISADNMFSVHEGECFGACKDAPVIIENNHQMHEKIDENQVSDFIAKLRKKYS